MTMPKWQDWLVARYPHNGRTDSPIEALFGAAVRLLLPHFNFGDGAGLAVDTQQQVGAYRVDFLISVTDKEGKRHKIVVELDGHDFHERTKEQAAKDKARDRWLTNHGIKFLRYAGTEVWNNPLACAQEVLDECFKMRWGSHQQQASWLAFKDTMDKLFADTPPMQGPR